MQDGVTLRAEATEQLQLNQSPWQMLKMLVLGIGMTALCAVLGLGLLDNTPPGSFGQFIGIIGVAFFGLCTVLIFWRFVSTRGPVVTLTPEGIQDKRVAAEAIPWTAVRGISTWQSHGQKFMVLAVDPDVESKLSLTRTAAWTRGANRTLGADGLCITTNGLSISHDKLLKTATAYAQAAQVAGT
jgi:hypothetical protein